MFSSSFSLPRKNSAAIIVLLGSLIASAEDAHADPLRLRGDALVQTRSPVGLLVLSGEDRAKPWLDVETVTWLGAMGGGAPASSPNTAIGQTTFAGDVLTLSVRARHAATGSEFRTGRLLVSMGAVRPVHVDGARGLARIFGANGPTLEAFGGVPVVRQFDYRPYSFAAGGRLGQAFGDSAIVGASYQARRRDKGAVDDEEVGADFALTPSRRFTAAGRAAFDLLSRGPTDALASISTQEDDYRLELFATHRSPGRMLPSTSLFSMLGDVPATTTGGTARWRAFPRLELLATASLQVRGTEDVGGQGLGRVTLALDDDFASYLGFEGRRVDFNGGRWLGARAIASVPIVRAASLRASTELEIVRRDNGDLLPWALGAIGWSGASNWEFAAAVEASSATPFGAASSTVPVQMLARASYTFARSAGSR